VISKIVELEIIELSELLLLKIPPPSSAVFPEIEELEILILAELLN